MLGICLKHLLLFLVGCFCLFEIIIIIIIHLSLPRFSALCVSLEFLQPFLYLELDSVGLLLATFCQVLGEFIL